MTPNKNISPRTTQELTESQTAVLAQLDQNAKNFVQAGCVMNLVGVLIGLKPSAYLEESEALIPALKEIGLHCKKTRRNGGVAVSYVPKHAAQLAHDIRKTWGKKTINEPVERRIGALLGYPDTAIDYFAVRSVVVRLGKDVPLVMPKPGAGVPHEAFIQFILSPEHFEEELAQYAVPLEAATRQLAPHSYEVLTAEV